MDTESVRLRMSGEEIKRLRVIRDLLGGVLSQAEAAEKLQISTRQVRRLAKRVQDAGEKGLIHGLVGRPSNRSLKAPVYEEVLRLWREKYGYADLNFTHFTEKLNEIEKIEIGRESVRKLLRSRGLTQRKVKRARKHRKRRERKPRFGELLQQDTSPHDWRACGEIEHLVAIVDDATSALLYAQLFEADGTLPNLAAMKAVFSEYGLPFALYTDKATWFHGRTSRQRLPYHSEEEYQVRKPTHIGRALQRLGVELIAAHSPQAKGRIERANRTLQDRLIAELKLYGMTTREQANRFIREHFIPEYNLRFAVPAAEAQSAFVTLANPEILHGILCLEFFSQVQNDNTVSRSGIYQLQCLATASRAHWAKARVKVRIQTDGQVLLHHADTGESIPFQVLQLQIPQEPKHGQPLPQPEEEDIPIWQKRTKSGRF